MTTLGTRGEDWERKGQDDDDDGRFGFHIYRAECEFSLNIGKSDVLCGILVSTKGVASRPARS